MENKEILKNVQDIFVDVLDNDNIQLTDETTAADVDDWDSLNHIQLIVAVEKKFKIRFRSDEIRGWNNIGEMIKSIQDKL
jgi:acyl carrier protein